MGLRASVVMPVFNAARTIDRQLEALGAQRLAGDLEVIVADNGSDDATVARVSEWTGRVPTIRLVDASDRRGAAHARNRAFASATCTDILGCDSDDVVDPEWATRLLDGLADADLVAGGTLAWPADDDDDVAPPPRGSRPPYDMKLGGLGFKPVVIGSSFAVRRAAWDAVGGFDETLPQAEDFDFAYRVQLAGYRFASRPDAFVHYRVPASTDRAMKKYFDYGRFQPLLYRGTAPTACRAGVPPRSPRSGADWPAARRSSCGRRSNGALGASASRDACGRVAGSVEFRVVFP